MIALLLTACATLASTTFEVHPINLPSPAARVLLAPVREKERADIVVLNGNELTAYAAPAIQSLTRFVLPAGVSAFDIHDIDDDGRNEIVMVSGDQIISVAITETGDVGTPRELFSLHTLLAGASDRPFPYVLVVHDGLKPMLALPCEDTFELRNIDGTRVKSLPIGPDAPKRVSFGAPIETWANLVPEVGRSGALEGRINRTVDFAPEWPAEVPIEVELPRQRRGTQTQMRDAANLDEASWPWFPLHTDGSSKERVLYALDPPDYRSTLLRIRTSKQKQDTENPRDVQLGPKRRYPGRIVVLENDTPDFNGDGFVDILCVSAPDPAASIDGITRAVVGRVWPCRITAHLFSADKQRYDPVPAARIEHRLPVAWLLTSELTDMARYWIARDLNGDKRSDLVVPVASDRIAVWLSTEEGFRQEPDFTFTLDEPLLGVDFRADLDGKGRTTIGLRTEHTLHTLAVTNEN